MPKTICFLIVAALTTTGWAAQPPQFPTPKTLCGKNDGGRGTARFGKITRVENIEPDKDTKPDPGGKLWVVRFEPPTGTQDEAPKREARLLDAAGGKYPPLKALGKLRQNPTDKPGWVTLTFLLEGLVFSLPQGTTPQSFQCGEEPALKLPAPQNAGPAAK